MAFAPAGMAPKSVSGFQNPWLVTTTTGTVSRSSLANTSQGVGHFQAQQLTHSDGLQPSYHAVPNFQFEGIPPIYSPVFPILHSSGPIVSQPQLGFHPVVGQPVPAVELAGMGHTPLSQDIPSALIIGLVGGAMVAESYNYFIRRGAKPNKPAVAAPVIPIPEEYKAHFANIAVLQQALMAARYSEARVQIAAWIAQKTISQMAQYQADLSQTDITPERRIGILKAIGEDFETLYKLNQTVWGANYSVEFTQMFEEFRRFYFESENNPVKSLPQLGVSTINNVITLMITVSCCLALDLAYSHLHAALPGMFYEFKPTYDYLDVHKLEMKLFNFAWFGGLFNWGLYFGRNGWFAMNTKGPKAKAWNKFASVVETPAKLVYGAAAVVDKRIHSIAGESWEPFANGIRVFYDDALFGFTKYVKTLSPKNGISIGTALELIVGSANTVLNAVLFNGSADSTFVEKFAKAFEKPGKFVWDQVTPSFLMNFLRASAQTKISQNPKNDNVTAQILRTVNGVFSGGAFYAVNQHSSVIQTAVFYLSQLGLGRLTHWFADTTNDESVRDRFAIWRGTRKGKG